MSTTLEYYVTLSNNSFDAEMLLLSEFLFSDPLWPLGIIWKDLTSSVSTGLSSEKSCLLFNLFRFFLLVCRVTSLEKDDSQVVEVSLHNSSVLLLLSLNGGESFDQDEFVLCSNRNKFGFLSKVSA